MHAFELVLASSLLLHANIDVRVPLLEQGVIVLLHLNVVSFLLLLFLLSHLSHFASYFLFLTDHPVRVNSNLCLRCACVEILPAAARVVLILFVDERPMHYQVLLIHVHPLRLLYVPIVFHNHSLLLILMLVLEKIGRARHVFLLVHHQHVLHRAAFFVVVVAIDQFLPHEGPLLLLIEVVAVEVLVYDLSLTIPDHFVI